MKRIFILITLLMLGGEAAAKCTYSGTTKRQGLTDLDPPSPDSFCILG